MHPAYICANVYIIFIAAKFLHTNKCVEKVIIEDKQHRAIASDIASLILHYQYTYMCVSVNLVLKSMKYDLKYRKIFAIVKDRLNLQKWEQGSHARTILASKQDTSYI